jgi:hypothetical protein
MTELFCPSANASSAPWMSVSTLLLTAAVLSAASCHASAGPSDQVIGVDPVLERLRSAGEPRVMVSLVLDPGADNEPAAIERARDAVLAALDTADFRVTHRFERVPAIGGVLRTERGLRILLGHPMVRRVDLDIGVEGTR